MHPGSGSDVPQLSSITSSTKQPEEVKIESPSTAQGETKSKMEHEPEKHSTSIIDKSKDMVATTVHVAQDVYQQVQDTLYQQQEQGASLPRRAVVAGATVLAVATEKVHEAGIPTAGVENVAHRFQQMTMLEQQREATKQVEEQKTGGIVASVVGKVPIIGRVLKGKTPEPQETTTSPRIEPVSVKTFEIPEHDQAEAGESREQREHVIPQQIPGGHEEEVAKTRPLSQESGMDVGTKERKSPTIIEQVSSITQYPIKTAKTVITGTTAAASGMLHDVPVIGRVMGQIPGMGGQQQQQQQQQQQSAQEMMSGMKQERERPLEEQYEYDERQRQRDRDRERELRKYYEQPYEREHMQQQRAQPPPSHLSEDIKLQRLRQHESEPSRQPLQVQRERGTMTGTEPPFESVTSVTAAAVILPITEHPPLEIEETKQGIRPQQGKKPSFWKKLKKEMKASVDEIRGLVSESPPPAAVPTRETTPRHTTGEYQKDPRIA